MRVRIPEDPGTAGPADAQTKLKLLAGCDVRMVRPTCEKSVRAKPASAPATSSWRGWPTPSPML